MDDKRTEKCTNELGKFFKDYLRRQIDLSSAFVDECRQNEKEAADSRFASAIRIAELQRFIDDTQKKIANKNNEFESDFDEIMALEGVRKIVVRPDNREVEIYTKRLDKFLNDKTYDIGQYIITIDFNGTNLQRHNNPRGHIRIREGGYRGEFRHVYIGNGVVCFGSGPGSGLNSSIDKLYLEFNIVQLVHLILSFLRLESTPPVARENNQDNTEPLIDAWENSDEEKPREKAAFINFCLDTMRLIEESAMEEKLRYALIEHNTIEGVFFKERQEVAVAERRRKNWLLFDNFRDDIIKKEIVILLEELSVINISYKKSCLFVTTKYENLLVIIRFSMTEAPIAYFRTPESPQKMPCDLSYSEKRDGAIASAIANFEIGDAIKLMLAYIIPSSLEKYQQPEGGSSHVG